MNPNFLEFEQPIADLEAKIEELRLVGSGSEVNISEEVAKLQEKSITLTESIFRNLSSWQISQISRHPRRPYMLDYVKRVFGEFDELHGDRAFADDPADAHAWIHRAGRVLEDDLHVAAKRSHRRAIEVEYRSAIERDASGRRGDESQNGAPDGGLAAPGFTDEPERLAAPEAERHAVNRVQVAEVLVQILDVDHEQAPWLVQAHPKQRRRVRQRGDRRAAARARRAVRGRGGVGGSGGESRQYDVRSNYVRPGRGRPRVRVGLCYKSLLSKHLS